MLDRKRRKNRFLFPSCQLQKPINFRLLIENPDKLMSNSPYLMNILLFFFSLCRFCVCWRYELISKSFKHVIGERCGISPLQNERSQMLKYRPLYQNDNKKATNFQRQQTQWWTIAARSEVKTKVGKKAEETHCPKTYKSFTFAINFLARRKMTKTTTTRNKQLNWIWEK